MNKKLIALVLAFAMVFSSFTAAFAETTTAIPVDAQAAKDLGMIIGEENGVTPAYLATTPSRLTAAILFLRLKGLDTAALSYTSTSNFADASQVNWAGGKNVLAYLKAHPELGLIGVGNDKFDANALIDAQQYYKVMLEALGYKATTTTVAGDFLYADTLAFAATKGLTNAATTSFTINNVATATIQTLKATIKGSTKTLAASLVDSGVISAAKAIATGVYTAPVVASVSSVATIANNKIAITLENAIAAAPLATQIVIKDAANTAVTVKTAVLSADGKVITVTTNALNAFAAYTVSLNGVTKNFVALAVDTTKPVVSSAVVTSNNTVTVTFAEDMDKVTAENIANYAINNGLSVIKAELDSTMRIVTLTTSSQTVGTLYTATIQNVTDLAGNVMDKTDKMFGGMAKDTVKPTVDSVVVKGNTTCSSWTSGSELISELLLARIYQSSHEYRHTARQLPATSRKAGHFSV